MDMQSAIYLRKVSGGCGYIKPGDKALSISFYHVRANTITLDQNDYPFQMSSCSEHGAHLYDGAHWRNRDRMDGYLPVCQATLRDLGQETSTGISLGFLAWRISRGCTSAVTQSLAYSWQHRVSGASSAERIFRQSSRKAYSLTLFHTDIDCRFERSSSRCDELKISR